MEPNRLETLLNHYFDHALGAGEKQELESTLLASAEAREVFWEMSRWHGAIRQWGEEEGGRREAVQARTTVSPAPPLRVFPSPSRQGPAPGARGKSFRRPSNPSKAWWPLAVAASVVLGLFAWMLWPPAKSIEKAKEFAVLRHAATVVWADETSAPKQGAALRGGTLKLKSGALQLDFARGARVVLEGPAEFELLSPNSGALRSGKLFATVPTPAHGFTVQTPTFSAVDHGTQFGCIVPVGAPPELHVFQGAVGLETTANEKRELHERQAVRLAGTQVEEIPSNLTVFLTEERLVPLEDAAALARLKAWRQTSRAFSQHPGMLVHFDFEGDHHDGTLINRAPGAAPETNGAILGAEWAEGRWPGKGALKFGGGDRVRLLLPGEYTAMTFVAFLRPASLPHYENTLLGSDPAERLGETHWYVSSDGTLGWSVRVAPRGRANQTLRLPSAPVVSAETLDSWMMVATVFDGTTVTHYWNGKPVGRTPANLPALMQLGSFEVGNWNSTPPPDRPPRLTLGGFVGSIDELAILSVPLTVEEIQRLYDQGRPSR